MKMSNRFRKPLPVLFACFILISSMSMLACNGYDNGTSSMYNGNGNSNGNGNGNGNDNGNGHY